MSANTMDHHCASCHHEWVDEPAAWASHYNIGCPSCSSVYWYSKEHDDE